MPRADDASGALRPGDLPARIAAAAEGAQSGRLTLETEPGSFDLFFALGRLIGARAESGPGLEASLEGVAGERLAACARRASLSGRRLSVELAEAGVLDAEGVRAAVERHAAAVVARALRARRGRWRFEPGLDRVPGDAEVHLQLAPARVLLAAARALADEAALLFHLGDLDRVVALVSASDPALSAGLSSVEGFVMSRVAGRPTLAEVLAQAGSHPEARQALLGLLCAGIVRVTDDPPRRRPTPEEEAIRRELLDLSTRLPALTHFDVLGVPQDAGQAEVRAAWALRAVRLHPDRLRGAALADLAPRAGRVFARMSEAYRVLSDPAGRAAYAATLRRAARPGTPVDADATLPPAPAKPPRNVAASGPPDAKAAPAPRPAPASAPSFPTPDAGPRPTADAFLSPAAQEEQLFEARRLFRERRFWDALQIAERLLRQAKGRLMRERLHVLRARCRAENPRWRHDAEAGLRAALEEIPCSAELHYELACLYRRVGLEQRARTELRAALDCDPGHEAARRELAAAHDTPSGILRGLRERLAAARENAS